MPISAIDGCSEAHWADVLNIIQEAAKHAGFAPCLVSSANDTSILQKRIVQNLYSNPVAVCDVSARNPNVMFELGMRLAIDKPTIIIKDDRTPFSFDTSPIEHIEYPRDLRYSKIVDFKTVLVQKLRSTYEVAAEGAHSSFLREFGPLKVVDLDQEKIPAQDFILEEMRNLRLSIEQLKNNTTHQSALASDFSTSRTISASHFNLDHLSEADKDRAPRFVASLANVRTAKVYDRDGSIIMEVLHKGGLIGHINIDTALKKEFPGIEHFVASATEGN